MFRFNSLALGLVSAGVAVTGLTNSTQAAVNVLRNGVTWESTFEGDVAPTGSTPAWLTFDNNVGGTEGTDGDIYTISSPAAGNTTSYYITDDFLTGTARTMEFRVRIDPASTESTGDGSVQFFTSVDSFFMAVSVGKNFVSLNQGGTLIDSYAIDNTTGFNTFRVTVDRSLATDMYKVYANNNPTPVSQSGASTGQFVGGDIDEIIYGDTSAGGSEGISYTDFISWTDDGAFAPIPEPSSLALIGLAALSLRRRIK